MEDGTYSGRLVLFFQHGELVSAVCTEHAGAHLQVVCAGGMRLGLPEQRVVHAQPLEGAGGAAQALEKIAAVEEYQRRLAAGIDPEALWESLSRKPDVYGSRELARAAFGDGAGADHAAAVVRALQHDRVFFKFNGERYLALGEQQVAQARSRAGREKAQRDEIERCAEWLHTFVNAQEPGGEARDLCAGYLMQFAVHGTAAPQYVHIRTILRQAGIAPGRRECFDLLVKMGACSPDENLLLARHGVPCVWPEDALREAGELCDVNARQRREAAGLEAFSIDDPGTRDIDDAVSIEPADGGLRLGVHITDAASLLVPGCALDREASRRGTSLYLPEGTIPMLPPELSEKRLSLIAGQARPVLSVYIRLDDSGAVCDRSLQLGTIRVARRLSYGDVDEDIRAGGTFQRLYEVLMRVRGTRLAAGASGMTIPELQIRLTGEGEILLSVRERETPAQALVAECMILANHSAALFLRQRNVPALYRTQKPGRAAADLLRSGGMPLQERLRLRHAFNRTLVETRPRVHAGLGLDCYCSITSPLRKYLDLVVQRQLAAAVLAQEPLYSPEQLRDIAGAVQPVLTRAALVENERRRYWLYKKMEPLRGGVLPAVVLARRKKNYTVLLSDFLLEATAEPPDDRSCEPGREVQALLRDIDPFEGTISLCLL